MALPDDVTTFSLTFGPYTDAAGEPVLVGTKGKIKPSVSPIRHTASGSVVIDAPIPVEIDEFGVASVELAHTAQSVLSPDAFTYSVTWEVASRKPSPGNKQISVLPTDGTVIDFDLLGASEDVVGVYVPSALSVNGQTGVVVLDAADVGAATPADLAAGLATKVNGTTYTTGLAGKQDVATLGADVAANTIVRAALGTVTIAQVVGDGTTDEATAITSALTAGAGGVVVIPRRGTGTVLVGSRIVIPNGTRLHLASGVTLRRKAGYFGNLITNAAAAAGSGRDTDVALTGDPGSVIDGADNSGGSDGTGRHHVLFRRVDRLTACGWRGTSASGKYMLCVGNSTAHTIDIAVACSSDGVHVNGPASVGTIKVRGTSGDDLVSFTSTDYGQYNDTTGDIADFDFDAVGDSAGTAVAKFATAATTRIDRITGKAQHTGGRCAVAFANDTGTINVGTIRLRDVIGYGYTATGGKVDQLYVNGWRFAPTSTDQTAPAFRVMCNFDTIEITDPDLDSPYTTNQFLFVDTSATVTGDTIALRGGRVKGTGAYGVVVAGANNNIRRVVVDGLSRPGPSGGGAVQTTASGAVSQLYCTGVDVNGSAWIADVSGGRVTTEVFLDRCKGGINVGSTTSAFIRAAAGGTTTSGSNAITTGASVRSMSLDFKVDVSKLSGSASGDCAYNTNTGLTGGLLAGPCIYSGSKWVSLADSTKFWTPGT